MKKLFCICLGLLLAAMINVASGQDLLAMIESECQANDMRFGLGYTGVHTNSHIVATQPDWAQRNKDGKVFPFFQWHLICINSTYGDYYAKSMERIFKGGVKPNWPRLNSFCLNAGAKIGSKKLEK